MNSFSRFKGAAVVFGASLVGLLHSAQLWAEPASATTTAAKTALQSLSEPVVATVRRPLSIKGYKTYSGTKILFIRTPGLPMFDAHVSFAAGSAHTPHQPGLAALTWGLLNEGVEGKDLNAVLESFDTLGAKWRMNINRDRASFSLRSLSDEARRTPALELFTQVLGKPLLAEKSLAPVKSQLLNRLDLEDQNLSTKADQALNNQLFSGHSYAQSVWGTKSGLGSITREHVQDFHKKAYTAGNALITLVGDLSENDAKTIGAQIANALPQGVAITPLNTPSSRAVVQTPMRIERPSAQTHLRLAQTSVLRSSPDYSALQLASRIFTTRLMDDLRERRGLTYHVQASSSALQAQGTLLIELQTRPELADAVVARIEQMFRDYLASGPTQEELDNARQSLSGGAPLLSSSNAQILGLLHDINLHNLPLDLDYGTEQTLKLDSDSVKAALNRYFKADQWSTVILGPKTDQQSLPNPVESAANASCRASDQIVAS